MERESFEDEDVADILNQHYVAIKVDREERPDVDHIYMAACQALTGQGGWPLTVIMTPDAKPFFAGTYFPKESRYGRYGLLDILHTVQLRWSQEKEQVVGYAQELTQAISARQASKGELSEQLLEVAYKGLQQTFDKKYGGFGYAPKFPIPHNLLFLMRYWSTTKTTEAIDMVEKTLTAMRKGGIFDQLGYGFSRYSVDEQWRVPHFEKMLYDNALLCYAYLEAYQITQKQELADTAQEILIYLLRDMRDEQGGFYAAEDADSEGVEGKFYTWTLDEILSILGPEKGKIFAAFYHATAEGNFEQGTNILNSIGNDPAYYAQQAGMSLSEWKFFLNNGRQALYAQREKRIHPFKDKKILTGWNALVIVALSKAAKVLGKKEYLTAGEQCLSFIFNHLMKDKRLLARYKDGDSAFPAYVDDYAYLLWALLEIYDASGNVHYIDRALTLCQDMKVLFWDEAQGGFFFPGNDAQGLIMRSKEIYDGALPSGNSVAAYALLRLARVTEDDHIKNLTAELLRAFAGEVEKYPQAYSFFLIALHLYLSPPVHILLTGEGKAHYIQFQEILQKVFLPQSTIAFQNARQQKKQWILPKELDGQSVAEKAAVYICENFACHPPITEPKQLKAWAAQFMR